MKLYSLPISPYASRVRIQILHKQLPIEIAAPPAALGSPELKSLNPTGRLPILDLGNGTQLAESWAIMEFLEGQFPHTPMLSSDPVTLARQRELVRFCDIYLAMSIVPMFRALRGAPREAALEAVKAIDGQFAQLDRFLARRGDAPFDLTDAALIPVVWYAELLAAHFGSKNCLAPHANVVRWWGRVSTVPAAAKVIAELDAGVRAAVPALFAA